MALMGTTVPHDEAIVTEILPLLEDLRTPLRFLSDLKAVWPDLTPEQREELENLKPLRERFHERLATGYLRRLENLTGQLSSGTYRALRDDLMTFIENWQEQEPDKLKVFKAMIEGRLDSL